MSDASDELQDHLKKLLLKSRSLRKQADEIDTAVEALRRLVGERSQPARRPAVKLRRKKA